MTSVDQLSPVVRRDLVDTFNRLSPDQRNDRHEAAVKKIPTDAMRAQARLFQAMKDFSEGVEMGAWNIIADHSGADIESRLAEVADDALTVRQAIINRQNAELDGIEVDQHTILPPSTARLMP